MSLSQANARGWGNPGGPKNPKTAAKFEAANIVKVTGGGISVRVNRGIAPLVKYALDQTVIRGYNLAGVADDWGYANRYIRGSVSTLSNHAWGLALDLNATKNPMTSDGKNHTDMPAWMVALWQSLGFLWGGNYKGIRHDTMHYEYMGTPQTAEAMRVQLGLPVWSA